MEYRITLISANRLRVPYPVYPLATAYLKSYLDENLNNCIIDIWDMNIHSDDETVRYLIDKKPHFVCLSIRNVDGANSLDRKCFFTEYKKTVDLIRQNSKAPIIVGGAGFSIFPNQFVDELNADFGISGEGEDALCKLINALINKAPTDNIQRLHIPKQNNKPACKYITSPQAKYDPILTEYYYKHSGMMNIQTKRGCPYNCIYCTYPQIDGKRVRTMDVNSIVETIAKAKHDFGVKYWFFTDSVFNIKNSYNNELCEAIVKAKLDISWGAYFSPSNITDNEMRLYKESGLTHIEFGSESFCDETLNAYGKLFTFDDIEKTSNLALKHNVYYAHFLILAGYGENKTLLHQTIENSKHLKWSVMFPYVGMRIYPNTILYDKAISEGVISKNTDLIMPAYYISKDFDLTETKLLAQSTNKRWVFLDEPEDILTKTLKIKRNKKGPLWEYLRMP